MKNIILTGMPGAGKSTVGVVLAKKLGYSFLDSDLVIQEKTGKLLHQLIEERGEAGFLMLENEINASIDTDRTVIATGGSAIYGKEAINMFFRNKFGFRQYSILEAEVVNDTQAEFIANFGGYNIMAIATVREVDENGLIERLTVRPK